jgi:hypothetical protein
MADPGRTVVYAALVATTGAALLVGALVLGLRWKGLARATGLVLEAVGVAMVFFVANIVAGALFVAGLRAAGVFVSVYAMDDLVLVVLSAGQAFVFHAWLTR